MAPPDHLQKKLNLRNEAGKIKTMTAILNTKLMQVYKGTPYKLLWTLKTEKYWRLDEF